MDLRRGAVTRRASLARASKMTRPAEGRSRSDLDPNHAAVEVHLQPALRPRHRGAGAEHIVLAMPILRVPLRDNEPGIAQHIEVLDGRRNSARRHARELLCHARLSIRQRLEDAPPHRVSECGEDDVRVWPRGVRRGSRGAAAVRHGLGCCPPSCAKPSREFSANPPVARALRARFLAAHAPSWEPRGGSTHSNPQAAARPEGFPRAERKLGRWPRDSIPTGRRLRALENESRQRERRLGNVPNKFRQPVRRLPGVALNHYQPVRSLPSVALNHRQPVRSLPGVVLNHRQPVRSLPSVALNPRQTVRRLPSVALNPRQPVRSLPGVALNHRQPVRSLPGVAMNHRHTLRSLPPVKKDSIFTSPRLPTAVNDSVFASRSHRFAKNHRVSGHDGFPHFQMIRVRTFRSLPASRAISSPRRQSLPALRADVFAQHQSLRLIRAESFPPCPPSPEASRKIAGGRAKPRSTRRSENHRITDTPRSSAPDGAAEPLQAMRFPALLPGRMIFWRRDPVVPARCSRLPAAATANNSLLGATQLVF